MVPASFTPYFTATATGALIGLLFVAVSLRSDSVFGEGATAQGRANAGSAFTALVNCFFVSLVALLPQTGLGYVSITLAIISLLATVRLHREVGRQHLQLSMLVFGLLTYVAQLVNGVLAEVYQSNHGYVYFAAFLMIGQVSGALTRAWSLVEGRHLVAAAQQAEPAAPTSESSAP